MDLKNIVKKIAKVYKKPLEFMKEYVKDPEKKTHAIKRIIDQYLCVNISVQISQIFLKKQLKSYTMPHKN